MVEKYDYGAETSYIKRAGEDYTYFDMGDNGWNEAFNIVQSEDEMWHINAQFLKEQKSKGCIFYFSHDPYEATGFMKMEVDYIKKELNAKAIKKIDENLWKVIW